jgi:hypothetical protein
MLTAECALPWMKRPTCVVGSDLEFRRDLFTRQTADLPEVTYVGKVVDERGKRIEGAKVGVWLARGAGQTPLMEESSAKDGLFRLRLRTGPWTYALRIAHPGYATEIVEKLPLERLEKAPGGGAPRVVALSPEHMIRGRVVDAASGSPVAGALVQALASPEDAITTGEAMTGDDGSFAVGGLGARRYYLNLSKFGWQRSPPRSPVTAPAQRVVLKLNRASVIQGLVEDADGEAEPNARVAAVLSGVPGTRSYIPLTWSADNDGRFAWDSLPAGTYYLWARRGEMMAYPPAKVELPEGESAPEVRLTLAHKGARVSGRVVTKDGQPPQSPIRVVLMSRSPLAYPTDAVSEVGPDGDFQVSGLLPGRYAIRVRSPSRAMLLVGGPREVEVPVEPGSTLQLKDPVVVRPHAEE